MTALSVGARGFAEIASRTRADLRRTADDAVRALPIDVREWAIGLDSLPEQARDIELLDTIAAWAGDCPRCLYVIECRDDKVDRAAVAAAFARGKASAVGGRAYARLNHDDGDCLYVGSSQSLAKRVAEHLGYGACRTYALHLRHWAPGLGLTANVSCAKYSHDTSLPTLQALEDTLWLTRRPMFGRQGRR